MDLLKMFDDIYKASQEQDEIIDGSKYIEKALNLFKDLGCSEIFEKNIQTLTIKKPFITEFEKEKGMKADGSYYSLTNTISIYNMDILFHELAHVASCKDEKNEGVLVPGDDYEFIVGKSFNEGFCDYIASKLDPNYTLRYPLEKLIVDKVIEKFGNEPLKYFLTADYKAFHQFINQNNLNSLLSNLDKYTNLYSKIDDPNKLEEFYDSYHTIMDESLTSLCPMDEIDELEENFLSTPKGTEIDTILYKQDIKNIKKSTK